MSEMVEKVARAIWAERVRACAENGVGLEAWGEGAFFVADALLLGAVYQYIHKNMNAFSSGAPEYDEILFMRRVDLKNDSISSFEVKSL